MPCCRYRPAIQPQFLPQSKQCQDFAYVGSGSMRRVFDRQIMQFAGFVMIGIGSPQLRQW